MTDTVPAIDISPFLTGDPAGKRAVAQAFADAVLRFFQDPAAATAQGGRNQARVAGHFSLEAMVDAYAALYRKTREQLAT